MRQGNKSPNRKSDLKQQWFALVAQEVTDGKCKFTHTESCLSKLYPTYSIPIYKSFLLIRNSGNISYNHQNPQLVGQLIIHGAEGWTTSNFFNGNHVQPDYISLAVTPDVFNRVYCKPIATKADKSEILQ